MAINRSEYERTLTLASTALDRIKALRLAATPRNFEIWYTYAAGRNVALTEAINAKLGTEERISEHDLGQLYQQFLSTPPLQEQNDEITGRVMGEIEQVMSTIGSAIETTDKFRQSLDGAAALSADEFSDGEQLHQAIETIIAATKEAQAANQTLQNGLFEACEQIKGLQEDLERARAESLTDPLTTLSNRTFFQDSIAKMMNDAEKRNIPFSVALADIDHFRKFNDTYGHLTGDQVLRLVALSLKNNLKGQDVAARYGGEEFAVLLPRTGLAAANIVADHIRTGVMSKELMRRSTKESLGRVTISLGVASWQAGDTILTLLERADACLYAAKRAGRNCVVGETALEQKVA